MRSGQQVFVDLLAQPGRPARRLGSGHLRAGGARRARRGRADLPHRPGRADSAICSGGIIAALAAAAPRRHREDRLAGARPRVSVLDHAPGRHAGRAGRPRPGRRGDRDVPAARLPGRPDPRRGLRLAAPGRPDLELLGQQLPARPEAAGVRRPVLERRHHPDDAPGCTPTSSTWRCTTRSPTPGARRPCSAGRWTSREVTSDSYVVAGVADHITPWQSCYRSAVAARRRRPASCCPPVATSPRWSTRPATPRRPTRSTEHEPGRSAGVAADRGHRAGQLVAGLRRPGSASGPAAAQSAAPTRAGRRRLCAARPTPPARTSSTGEEPPWTTTSGGPLGTDYFRIADQLTPDELDYLAPDPRLRRRGGAAGHQRLLGAGRVPLAADRAARPSSASSATGSTGTAARR